MEIFIDSGNIFEIKKWLAEGAIDGVTTDLSILLKDNANDIESGIKDIAKIIGDKPLGVGVTTNNLEEMISEAEEYNSWAKNMVVKVPVINEYGESCLSVINKLSKKDIKVNVTGIMSFNQIVLASKTGASYLSIIAGRVSDEGSDAAILIERAVEHCEKWNSGKILVENFKGTTDIQKAISAGTHIVAMPPQFLQKMIDNQHTRETVKEFIKKAREATDEVRNVSRQVDEIFPAGKDKE